MLNVEKVYQYLVKENDQHVRHSDASLTMHSPYSTPDSSFTYDIDPNM